MARYILSFDGIGAMPAEIAASIRELQGLKVIDESPKRLLVESAGDPTKTLRQAAFGNVVSVSPERGYRTPDPRPRIQRPPGDD